MSSDDERNNNNNNNNNNNYNVALSSSSSSPLTHRQTIKNVICPPTAVTAIIDEDAHEVAAITEQRQQALTNNTNENTSILTSRIKTPTTPTITSKWTSSRQSSRMASPALSTSSQSSGRVITFLNHEVIQLPYNLEREIRVKHHFEQLGTRRASMRIFDSHLILYLGLVVDAYVDEGVNGCFLRSITPTSTSANQHGLRPGDYILSINNENMKKISNAQARSIIRRASLIGSDIRYSSLIFHRITFLLIFTIQVSFLFRVMKRNNLKTIRSILNQHHHPSHPSKLRTNQSRMLLFSINFSELLIPMSNHLQSNLSMQL